MVKLTHMKTILCAEEQKELIYHQMLENEHRSAISQVRLVTLSNLLKIDETEDNEALSLRLSKLLNAHKNEFPIYAEMFQYPVFCSEILSFARTCALYSITPQELPRDTASEMELAEITSLALLLPLREKRTAAAREELLNQAADLAIEEDRIVFEADPFRAAFRKELHERITSMNTSASPVPAEQIELRRAPSVQMELEAIAQDIVKQGTSCAVVLTSVSSQLPVLKQVFARYGIPCFISRETITPSILPAFVSLVRFALSPSAGTFLTTLRQNAFPVSCSSELVRWLEDTCTEAVYQPLADQIASLSAQDIHEAERMDQQGKEFFQAIETDLKLLKSSQCAADAFKHAYQVLRNSPLLKTETEFQTALQIRSRLNQVLPLIETREEAEFVLRELEGMRVSAEGPRHLFCQICDLSHPAEPVETLYVTGCSSTSFPGVPVRNGLFDEAYVAKISRFPTLSDRYDLWKEQLSWLENTSRHVIYSYPEADYQGKEIQPSFSLTSRIPTITSWKIDQPRPRYQQDHFLFPETAYALYGGTTIRSSVSRVERWFYCPYSWFIQSGLRISEFRGSMLDSATIGNYAHAFMNHAVSSRGKDYPSFEPSKIEAFLTPAFDSLSRRFPHQKTLLQLSKQRLVTALTDTLRVLGEAEAAAPSWHPNATESLFEEPISEHVYLKGIIDRIDFSAASLRILDYKSSSKSLSEIKVKAGLQLQLLSYLIIAQKLSGRTPAGAYYIPMTEGSVPAKAGVFKKTNKNGVELLDANDNEILHQYEISGRKLSGWAVGESELSEEAYKLWISPGSGRYSYARIKDCIESLYEYFYFGVTAGEISVTPVKGACTFCSYRPICRYHNPELEVKELVYEGIPLKMGKEEADHENG